MDIDQASKEDQERGPDSYEHKLKESGFKIKESSAFNDHYNKFLTHQISEISKIDANSFRR